MLYYVSVLVKQFFGYSSSIIRFKIAEDSNSRAAT